ncbi:VOC family protein [Pseudogracilibacillus auburnensis]|uniref:Catechol 2,3-dioxygenase-like lactoylglutathione lyase family enzyme n=1 Tax=Pseudogracilibacillus auburnensis TaxID=1494959 RepID=A0A2V3VGV6_9BACI|nr:VOC family protein [Pseudogracilibacillus auburnensis]PXW80830.1 catechol 2,3-dioxygenase-like lactoylglutathione lyase family enzyme [Pseudogracilibacillus auburnensis]
MIREILYEQIPVKNISDAVPWYTEVLGFTFIWHNEDEQLAQLNLPSGQMLFLFETTDQTNTNFSQNGTLHGAVGFHTKNIEELYHHLKAFEVNVTDINNDGENKFLNFYDPDGNLFNVQCDG